MVDETDAKKEYKEYCEAVWAQGNAAIGYHEWFYPRLLATIDSLLLGLSRRDDDVVAQRARVFELESELEATRALADNERINHQQNWDNVRKAVGHEWGSPRSVVDMILELKRKNRAP